MFIRTNVPSHVCNESRLSVPKCDSAPGSEKLVDEISFYYARPYFQDMDRKKVSPCGIGVGGVVFLAVLTHSFVHFQFTVSEMTKCQLLSGD